nr:chaperone for general secretion pathway YbaY [Shewanella ferrihydritica]
MLMKVKSFFLLALMTLGLSACVTVEPEPPVVVNGAAGYLEKVLLPQGSE